MKKIKANLSTVPEWLLWIAKVNPKQMDLTLTRIEDVAKRLGILPVKVPVIVVGGTNGKGSTVAGLESIYHAAEFRTGTFTSPFLFRFNEQIRIAGEAVSDELLCQAFAEIEAVRVDITLTPFEFTTLAALLIFKAAKLDVWILEVGLGGRLDAVNIIDADVAIVTSIALDHTDWLGPTREHIGVEKAGIFRKGRPAICGDVSPPQSLIEKAQTIGAALLIQDQDFGFREMGRDWWCKVPPLNYDHLPKANLVPLNMSTVLMAITKMQHCLPVTLDAIKRGIDGLGLPGRIQTKINASHIPEIYDVAHNPAAIAKLADYVKAHPVCGKNYAVFSMLADKDIVESINNIASLIDEWLIAPLAIPRGATVEILQKAFEVAGVKKVRVFSSIKKAYAEANTLAKMQDRIIIFGSFHTVAIILQIFD